MNVKLFNHKTTFLPHFFRFFRIFKQKNSFFSYSTNGSPEAVKEGENGFLLTPGDISGIAEKTVFLLKNPEKAKEMGQKGSSMVENFVF